MGAAPLGSMPWLAGSPWPQARTKVVESSGAGTGQELPLLGLAGAGSPGSADDVHLGAAVRVLGEQIRETEVVAGGQAEGQAVEVEGDGFVPGVDGV